MTYTVYNMHEKHTFAEKMIDLSFMKYNFNKSELKKNSLHPHSDSFVLFDKVLRVDVILY